VGSPDRKECENWLNSKRIKESIDSKTVFGFPFDTLITQIGHQYERINDMNTELKNKERFVEDLRVEEFSEELLSTALSKIHGQQDNMKIIVDKVVTWVNRPDAHKLPLVLMFAGTSGTGKTYTAEMISNSLKSQGYLFVKLPMNEYKSEGDVWKLLGSSAGYIGSDKDTTLVAAHRKSDKLVILFDEMEKAHPAIFETIMTLMEKGELTNGNGDKFDFRKSIIIFTTNLAMEKLIERKQGLAKANVRIDDSQFQQAIKDILKRNHIKTEVCGRIDSVFVYNPLDSIVVARIAIEEIRNKGLEYGIQINNIPEELLRKISTQVAGSNEGARPIKRSVCDELERVLQIHAKLAKRTPSVQPLILDLLMKGKTWNLVHSAIDHLLSVEEIINQYPNLTTSPRTAKFEEKQLSEALQSVKGQQDNMKVIVEETKRWIRKVKKKKPLVFMFAGTSGTGKTYTAERICSALKDYKMVKLNMNEYHNEGDIWKLLGSSTGYVGSDKESPIFTARRETSKLVILFDEIEKAHPSLFTTIMTLMEKGEMANGHGENYDFKNAIIIFTTNLAMNELLRLKKESILRNVEPSSQEFQDAAKSILKSSGLKEEISGRLDWLLVYNTLDASIVAQIALDKVRSLGREYEITINHVPIAYLEDIARKCKGNNEGARPIERIILHDFEPVFQDAYETGNINSDQLYDIDDMLNIVPSKDNNLMSVDEIEIDNATSATHKESESIPVIQLCSNPYFKNGYNYDEYRKAIGLLVLDNGSSGFGSGFLISDNGYILTCEHCTNAGKITFVKDDDKTEYDATVVYKNSDLDIAVLKIEATNTPYLMITDSNKPLKVGTEVVILGYPSGIDINVNVSAYEGKIANIDKVHNAYQTDAIATHGSSGGAFVCKADGIVYGVLKGGFKEANINIATDIRKLLQMADSDFTIEYI
jgi:ATP-dependent Clp protease ATP-binding subunit ClpA